MSAKIQTAIWQETPSIDQFQAEQCFCYGYSVTKDLMQNASWVDYIYLLISGKRATILQRKLLKQLAVLLANPGIRDLSVRAAMNAGVAKAPAASVLIAALSSSSGQYGGSREVYFCMKLLKKKKQLSLDFDYDANQEKSEIWPDFEHTPGFNPHARQASPFILASLDVLANASANGFLVWLKDNRIAIEKSVKSPISLNAVIAAAFCDLNLTEEQSEYLFLILRLPGTAAHAMEQKSLGWQSYPFFADVVDYENNNAQPQLPQVDDLIIGYIND